MHILKLPSSLWLLVIIKFVFVIYFYQAFACLGFYFFSLHLPYMFLDNLKGKAFCCLPNFSFLPFFLSS